MNYHRYNDIIGASNPVQGGYPQPHPHAAPQGPVVGNWGPGGWGGEPFFGAGEAGGGGYAPPSPIQTPALALGPGSQPLALKKPLGCPRTCLPANGTVAVNFTPQEFFKPVRFVLGRRTASQVSITSMSAGVAQLLASIGDEVLGEMFLPEASGLSLNGYTVLPNQPIIVTFKSRSDMDLIIEASFEGWAAAGQPFHLYGPNAGVQVY